MHSLVTMLLKRQISAQHQVKLRIGAMRVLCPLLPVQWNHLKHGRLVRTHAIIHQTHENTNTPGLIEIGQNQGILPQRQIIQRQT
ncbi:MAG: hypothetical protein DWI22_14525 [Planctomycetota bacterium]|nr:MAG: hypothetical protein DWI22_14525 [Planctomycetota bacterium]